MYNSLCYYVGMDDKERQFMKWCENMPKDFMRLMWRIWLVQMASDRFIEGEEDNFMVKDIQTPKPFRPKKTPPITDDDIIKLAKELNMSVESIRKIMYKKPKN